MSDVTKPKACATCGAEVLTVERASGGYVEIVVQPSDDGDLVRLSKGKDVGKYLKLSGPLRDKCVNDPRMRLYLQHECEAAGLF